jgi:hypothetical protein
VFGSAEQSSAIVAQNPTGSTIWVEARYYRTGSSTPVVGTFVTSIESQRRGDVGPKQAGVPSDFLGSGVIKAFSDSARTTPADCIVSSTIYSVKTSAYRMSYGGFNDNQGSYHLSIPYVAMSNSSSGLRSFVDVQNIGGGTASATVQYYNGSGTPHGSPQSFNPGSMGMFSTKTTSFPLGWQGSLEITSNQPLIAIANTNSGDMGKKSTYSAVPIP